MRRQDLLRKHRLQVEYLEFRIRKAENDAAQARKNLEEMCGDVRRMSLWKATLQNNPDCKEFVFRFCLSNSMQYIPVESLGRFIACELESSLKKSFPEHELRYAAERNIGR